VFFCYDFPVRDETVLVTGVAGFIGAHVAEHCMKLSMSVVGLDDLSGGYVENVPEGVTFVEGSVTDHELVSRLFDEHRFQ
jgi:UDP-glucose 4-epimerase